MIFVEHKVADDLSDLVQGMIYYQGYRPDHDKEKLLPDGTANLVIELQNQPQYIFDNQSLEPVQTCKQAWFSGLQTNYLTISSGFDAEMLVLTIKPTAVSRVINQSASQVVNRVLPAVDLFGDEITELRGELMISDSATEKFKRLETWLWSQIQPATIQQQTIVNCVEKIADSQDKLNLAKLAEQSGFSQRQFIQLCKSIMGLTPKQYHRIVRFNQILTMIHQQQAFDWAAVAHDCGYFDQAHFIRDFQGFVGVNPSQYAGFETDWKNYLSVPDSR